MTTRRRRSWTRVEALFEQLENPKHDLTVRDFLDIVALCTATSLLICIPVCLVFVVAYGLGVSSLLGMVEVFLPQLVGALALSVVAVLFGRFGRRRPAPKACLPPPVRVPAPLDRLGRERFRHRQRFMTARLVTAGHLAIQGTTVALVGLRTWPVWLSLATGGGFLVLAYVVQPPENGTPQAGQAQTSTGDGGGEETTGWRKPMPALPTHAAKREEGPRARGGPGQGLRRCLGYVLFIVMFYGGLLANAGVVVALGGGPLWALAGGIVAPPLIVGSFLVAPEE